jgi:tellurite resistance protein
MRTGQVEPVEIKPYVPTKKWFAALIVGVATVIAHAVASGGWDATENGELLALATALGGAYIKRNDPTLEGKQPA